MREGVGERGSTVSEESRRIEGRFYTRGGTTEDLCSRRSPTCCPAGAQNRDGLSVKRGHPALSQYKVSLETLRDSGAAACERDRTPIA